jgi:hypothetical protein
MRICPLGILGARHSLEQGALWAQQDTVLTHPHTICKQANALCKPWPSRMLLSLAPHLVN